MKPWLIAAVGALVLAKGTEYVMPLMLPGGDEWAVYPTAASVSLRSVLPGLAFGGIVYRFARRRFWSVTIAALVTCILLAVFARRASGLWLWQLGWLLIVPLLLCGLPLAYVMFRMLRSQNKSIEHNAPTQE